MNVVYMAPPPPPDRATNSLLWWAEMMLEMLQAIPLWGRSLLALGVFLVVALVVAGLLPYRFESNPGQLVTAESRVKEES